MNTEKRLQELKDERQKGLDLINHLEQQKTRSRCSSP